jgi:hypothetical protein
VKPKSVKSPKVKKDDNTLKTSVLVSQLSDVVQNHTHNFLDNSVVAVEPLLAASSILVIICSGWNT